jgi:spore coat protein H
MRAVLVAALVAGCGGGGDPGADAVPPGPNAEHVFDPTQIRTYTLELAPADWQWLNDNALLEEYRPGTLTYDGATYESVGIRFKGSVGNLALCFDEQGNRTCRKLSLKLDFAEYDAAGRFYGMKKINLHSMERDPSKLHDALGYRLFGDSGIHTARTAYGRVVVNGELLGLFSVVEQIDGRFTDDRFTGGGDGNLYKEVWPVHTVAQPYLDVPEWQAAVNELRTQVSGLRAYIAAKVE